MTACSLPHENIIEVEVEQGLTSHQTHYRSYRGRVFTGQMTQLTVSKHWRQMNKTEKQWKNKTKRNADQRNKFERKNSQRQRESFQLELEVQLVRNDGPEL